MTDNEENPTEPPIEIDCPDFLGGPDRYRGSDGHIWTRSHAIVWANADLACVFLVCEGGALGEHFDDPEQLFADWNIRTPGPGLWCWSGSSRVRIDVEYDDAELLVTDGRFAALTAEQGAAFAVDRVCPWQGEVTS